MLTSPEISCMFETSKFWKPLDSFEFDSIKEHIQNEKRYLAGHFNILHDRWYIVKDPNVDKNKMFCGNSTLFKDSLERNLACQITIDNFII
jgi:hypothetical protein